VTVDNVPDGKNEDGLTVFFPRFLSTTSQSPVWSLLFTSVDSDADRDEALLTAEACDCLFNTAFTPVSASPATRAAIVAAISAAAAAANSAAERFCPS
jgi:hypothetical protein